MGSFASRGNFIWAKPDVVVTYGGQDSARLPYDLFSMEFQVRDGVSNWPADGLPRRLRDLDGVGRLTRRHFVVGRDYILGNPVLGFIHLFNLLYLVNVPLIFRAPFAHLIHSRVSMLAHDAANVGRRLTSVVVIVDVCPVLEEDEEDEIIDDEYEIISEEDEIIDGEYEIIEEVLRSSLDDEINWMVPATKASIEALEKVEMEDVDGHHSTDKCMICLEELSVRISEVRKMPCSHRYHGDCIAQWLESSHVCPLCRFEMPTDSS